MTQKTKAQLDTLLANNTSGSITPANLRDFVDSCKPSRGAIHFTDTATATTINTQGTWTKASNTGTLIGDHRFSMPSDGRLQYDGTETIWARVAISLSISLVSGSSDVVAAGVGHNNAIYLPSIMRTKLAASGDVQGVSLLVDLELDPTDYIELFLLNETTTADLLVSHGYMTALGFLT